MRDFMSRWGQWTCVGLIACSISATGCKSGWKMPGKDMFSWNKKPSESTIAGKGPSMTFPQSPAANHSPTAIASSNSAAPTARPNSNFSTAGYSGGTPTTPASASSANGYQVGPYGMAGTTPATPQAGGPPSNQPVLGNNAAIGGAGSAYGAPASLASRPAPTTGTPGLPAVQTYGGAQNNPYGYRAPNAAGTAIAGTAVAGTGGAPSASSGFAPAGLAAGGSSAPPALAPLQPPANAGYANAGYPPATTNYSNALLGAPANPSPAGGAPAALNAPTNVANSPYSPGTTYPNGAVSNPYAGGNSSVTSAAGYRPGSTGRSTGYELAQPAGANMANSNSFPAPNSLPTNYAPNYQQNPPMMASPPASSGYQVPPIVR